MSLPGLLRSGQERLFAGTRVTPHWCCISGLPAQVAGNVAIDLRLSSEESSSCFCSSTLGDESSHLLAACVPWTTPFPLERMFQFSGRQLEYSLCQIPLNTSLIQCHTYLGFRRKMDAIKILYASPRKMASAKCPPRIVKIWIGIQHSHKGGSSSSTRMWRWDRNLPGAHQPAYLNQSLKVQWETLTQKNEEEANWERHPCKCVHKLVTKQSGHHQGQAPMLMHLQKCPAIFS